MAAADPAGPEVAILKADIDIVADGHADAGKELPGKLALASVELLDVGVADTAAEITADAAVSAEIGEAVDPGRENPGVAAEVEIADRREGCSRKVAIFPAQAGIGRAFEAILQRSGPGRRRA